MHLTKEGGPSKTEAREEKPDRARQTTPGFEPTAQRPQTTAELFGTEDAGIERAVLQ